MLLKHVLKHEREEVVMGMEATKPLLLQEPSSRCPVLAPTLLLQYGWSTLVCIFDHKEMCQRDLSCLLSGAHVGIEGAV